MKPATWSETKRRGETGGAVLEMFRRGAPNSCLTFEHQDHVSGQGQVKGQYEAFSHVGPSGRLDGLQRAQTHSECW